MSRKSFQQQIETAVQPLLTRGEEVRRIGPTWALEQRGRVPLVFRARDLHQVVLTDQRLVLLTQPRRRRPLGVNNLVIAKRYSTFSLDAVKRFRPMLQLRLRTSDHRVLVLEFRPRDRRLGLELAAELNGTANGDAAPPRPRQGLPTPPAVPVQPDHAPTPAGPTSAPPAPAPPPAQSRSFPVPIQPVDAPTSDTAWRQPDWDEQARESERRSRKDKRAAKKQAKQEAKEAKQARKAEKQAEKQTERQTEPTTTQRDEMLDYLQK